MAETIRKITLRRLTMPLHVPYRLSYRTFEEFEPHLVEIDTTEGRHGFGDGHISPGSSDETREGGWAFSRETAGALLGRTPADAMAHVRTNASRSKVAATAFATAIEMVGQSRLLDVDETVRLPLLSPIAGAEPDAIRRELDEVHAQGFRTVKIKVGRDLDADLARVAAIQEAGGGRFTYRIDANRAYDETEGCRFASGIDPEGIELFEQPCAAEAWDANAAVARASVVPLMLDEPIGSNADIERAAAIEGVGLCKLKLKRFGGPRGAPGIARPRALARHGAGARRRHRQRSDRVDGGVRGALDDPQRRRVQRLPQVVGLALRRAVALRRRRHHHAGRLPAAPRPRAGRDPHDGMRGIRRLTPPPRGRPAAAAHQVPVDPRPRADTPRCSRPGNRMHSTAEPGCTAPRPHRAAVAIVSPLDPKSEEPTHAP